MQGSDVYLRCPGCGLVTTLDAIAADEGCYMCGVEPVECADTGRDHAPGNLAGAIRFHAAQHDRAAIEARTAELPVYDTASSASRQHYIDTGRFLRPGEADSA